MIPSVTWQRLSDASIICTKEVKIKFYHSMWVIKIVYYFENLYHVASQKSILYISMQEVWADVSVQYMVGALQI